jgi:hypothetical protein
MGDIATTFKELENINSLMVLKGSIGQMTCDWIRMYKIFDRGDSKCRMHIKTRK